MKRIVSPEKVERLPTNQNIVNVQVLGLAL
jgi:hypothetical protein